MKLRQEIINSEFECVVCGKTWSNVNAYTQGVLHNKKTGHSVRGRKTTHYDITGEIVKISPNKNSWKDR